MHGVNMKTNMNVDLYSYIGREITSPHPCVSLILNAIWRNTEEGACQTI